MCVKILFFFMSNVSELLQKIYFPYLYTFYINSSLKYNMLTTDYKITYNKCPVIQRILFVIPCEIMKMLSTVRMGPILIIDYHRPTGMLVLQL